MIRVILNGAAGRMGREVAAAIKIAKDMALVASVDRPGAGFLPSLNDVKAEADVIIDFSHHSATAELMAYATRKNLPVLVATTGQTVEELDIIDRAAERIPVFRSSNMSLGIAVLIDAAKKIASKMPDADIEIVETHHNRKLDAPSGTAIMIANALKTVREKANFVLGQRVGKRGKNDIGILSVRRGNIVGIHEVLISTDTETITLKHEAHTRSVFADGAIVAARFLVTRPSGLYTMDDIAK